MGEHIVVLGNGMAGLRLVEELRARDRDRFAITVVGREPEPAYNRVLLSAVLAGEIAPDAICLKPSSWYADNGIALRLGDPAATVNVQTRAVTLASRNRLAFDRLVFATGSSALRLPIPGMNLDGVATFRDLADLAGIEAAADTRRPVVVIGGGLLGLEAAYGLACRGARVTLIHLMDRLMERQLDPRAAALLRAAIEARGVDVRLEASTAAIEGEDRVEAVRLADGSLIAADLVVVAAGIRAEKDLAEAAGIACGRGIRVDDGLETSVPGVHAIGECAEHEGIGYGLVEPAYEQARILADRLCGGDALYRGSVVATNLKVSGVNVFSAGEFLGDGGTEEIVLSDPGPPAYRKLVLRRDVGDTQRVVGAVLYGDVADALWYLELIRSRTPIERHRLDLIFGRAFVEAAA